MFGKQNLNVEVGGFKLTDVATSVGKTIDKFSKGKTNAEIIGKKIDDITKNITIKIDK